MPRAHPNGARTRRTPPGGAPARLRLDLADDAPGWTLADDGEADEARPLTVAQAVRHATDTHGPSGAVLVLGATRDALAELPPEQAAQLRAELVSATPGVLADVGDGLALLGDVLDALAPVAPPDVLRELTAATERAASRTATLRREHEREPGAVVLATVTGRGR